MNFTLTSGRVVMLDLFHALPTYLLFNAAGRGGTVGDWVAEVVQRLHYGSGVPLAVLPAPDPLTGSWYLCVAQLSSSPLSGLRDVAVQGSYLTLCWFVDSVDAPIRELVAQALPGIGWEAQARDLFSDW